LLLPGAPSAAAVFLVLYFFSVAGEQRFFTHLSRLRYNHAILKIPLPHRLFQVEE
jgi:hypothetical protein